MDQPSAMTTALHAQLQSSIRGDVRWDNLARTLYSVDASIYEIVPAGVILPRDRDDVVAAVNLCREHGVPIIPRGAGTGLAGGAVGSGVVLDCSRYMTGMWDLDPDTRTIRVQPGVVLDELNVLLAPRGLHFAPDVATASRATIGGMMANNSCGSHSIVHGRTVDHVAAVTVVLSDGNAVTWPTGGLDVPPLADHISGELRRIASSYARQVQDRFPKVLRRNGGYALDRICDSSGPINPGTIVCGSEGTLCVIVEAVLRLTPLPKCKGLLLVRFQHVLDALGATPAILKHRPAAVELVNRMITDAAARTPALSAGSVIDGIDAPAVLIVEFFDDAPQAVGSRIQQLQQDLTSHNLGYAYRPVTDPDQQKGVWDMRKRGLGLLMSRPGDHQPHAFVEDSSVDPSRLREYIERFEAILSDEGVGDAGYYAHAGAGVIHVRPVLNLKMAEDVLRMRRIADRVSDLALEFGGAMTGEHGDGIVRSCWLEKMYGPQIVQAFHEVKRAFDPVGLFNPGKIVDPLPMTENLRYGPRYRQQRIKTHLDFSAYGGMAGLAEMCSGVGECRKRLVGTMCPSYMATDDETHTTRARANAIRVALSNRGLIDGLADPAIEEVMDLCLQCKACKSECPTGVDMGRLKSEWLSVQNMREGVPRRARFVAQSPELARLGSHIPRVTNLLLRTRPVRAFLERRYGLDRRIPPPSLATRTFHQWFKRHRQAIEGKGTGGLGVEGSRGTRGTRGAPPVVVYFVDTWTNYYTPQVGIAAVKLLEAAGFHVLAPRLECCGRPLISKGLLTEAQYYARLNVERLAHFIDTQTPIVGTEPSCILTLVDEYPQLVPTADARGVAKLAQTMETFLARLLRDDPQRIRFADTGRRILYHGHCHQKAMIGTSEAMALLNHPPGFSTDQINSGCCGMAGAFGHEKEHYEVAKAIGDQRLFPAVRDRKGAEIAVSGFSCRQHIAHHTGVTAQHPVELLSTVLETG